MSNNPNNNKLSKYSFQFNNSIKVFISLYKFEQELKSPERKANSGKLFLLNKKWFLEYKKFYLFDKFLEIIKNNNLSDFDLTEQKIIFNNLFNDFYNQNSHKDLILFYDIEYPGAIVYTQNIQITYINDFEIINEEIYQNLLNCMGIFKYCDRIAISYEYKIIDNNIIIKYNNEEDKCFNLLIGNIGDITEIFVPNVLINFLSETQLSDEFKIFNNNKIKDFTVGKFDINTIKIIKHNLIDQNPYKSQVKFLNYDIGLYPTFTGTNLIANQGKNQKFSTIKIIKEKIIKALICYYLNNEKLKRNNDADKQSIKLKESQCYLINKSWIKAFKDFYHYHSLVNQIISKLSHQDYATYINNYGYNGFLINDKLNDKLVNEISQSNYSDEISILDGKSLIDKLNSIDLFLIDFDYWEKAIKENNDYIKIYDNFELISIEKNNFINALFPLFNDKYKKYQYYINEENYLFIQTDYLSSNILNAFNIKVENNEIMFNIDFIIKGNKFDDIYRFIKNNSITNHILSLDFNENLIYKSKELDETVYLLNIGKIGKKVQEKEDFKIVLFNYAEFIENIYSKSNTFFNNNYNGKFIHLVPYEYFTSHLEKYKLKYPEINSQIFLNEKDLSTKKKLISNYVNKNFKFPLENVLLNNKDTIQTSKFNNNSEKLPYIKVRNDTGKIYYFDNYFLFNENMLPKLKLDTKVLPKLQYFIRDQYILLFQPLGGKTIVHSGKLNEQNIFKLKFLIESIKDFNGIKNIIGEFTMINFLKSCFIFNTSLDNEFSKYSLFFDGPQLNIIGSGYQQIEKFTNFNHFCYNGIFMNIIYLIIYFKFPKYKDIKFNSGKYYYLISEEWINNYKTKYMYAKTKDEIEKNPNENVSGVIKIERKDKKLLKKIIYNLIGEMYKLNEEYNNKNFNLDDNPPEPEYLCINNFLDEGPIFFYNNYFLLDQEIHNKLFNINEQQSNEMKKKNYYCKCFYGEEYIFVVLGHYLTQTNNIVIEVGNLNEEQKFNLIYLFVINSEKEYKSNFENMIQIGIQNYFASLVFNENNIVTLTNNSNQICGFIYKYSEDNKAIINNNINISINPYLQQDQQTQNYPAETNLIPINLKQVFPEPPKQGLQNVGATCYMNATIQCFGQIEKFTLYFKYDHHIREVIRKYNGNDCLTEAFKELIENLWPDKKEYLNKKYIGKNANNSYYKPYKFKEKISRMNPLFQGAQANDSKDLVNFIVMQLHEELNIGKKLNISQQSPQINEIEIYKNFCKNYYYENKSIISDLFYGVNGTVYECSGCQTRKYNFQIGFFFIFPLEEVRKFKIQQLQSQNELYIKNMMMNNMIDWIQGQNLLNANNIQLQNINSVSIIDCFDYNQKMEYMTGDNAMYCNTCNRTENASYQNYIADLPEVLIIILNRGQGIQFKVKCEFYEFLDIRNYVKYPTNSAYNYKLIGVVTHLGGNDSSGHFVAFCKSPIDDNWYNYNDDLCILVNNFKEQVLDFAMPYILFYQKVN